jgi:CheY-like chemotaxis protein
MPRTVLVADPDPRSAVAFSTLLRHTDYAFAGAVAHGRALVDAVWKLTPWAVAVDLSLPDHPSAPNVGWVATVHHLREIAPAVRTLLTFEPHQAGLVPGAMAGGARAFAEKPFLGAEILAALDRLQTDLPPPGFFARARRVPRNLTLRYRVAGAGAGCTAITRVGLVRDLSETGFGLQLPEPVPLRTVLLIDVELPDRTSFRGRSQLVREIRSDRGTSRFEYGAALFDAPAADRARLRDFIARVLAGDPVATGDTTRYLASNLVSGTARPLAR